MPVQKFLLDLAIRLEDGEYLDAEDRANLAKECRDYATVANIQDALLSRPKPGTPEIKPKRPAKASSSKGIVKYDAATAAAMRLSSNYRRRHP